jgi:hypothetical protein
VGTGQPSKKRKQPLARNGAAARPGVIRAAPRSIEDAGSGPPAGVRLAFEEETTRALERLRLAVARLVAAVPSGAERAADLRRSLDLDAALAWQLHTLAGSDDVLRAGRVVPKAGAMDRFFKAVHARRLPLELEREARDAYAGFERLVGEHAGSRETFDAMVTALRPDDGAALQRLRRTAYRANASVWGISVRTMVHCVVFRQRPTGEHDCLSIRGRVGVRRLQESAVVGIYASGRTWGGSTCPPEGAPAVALDPCEVLAEYCSTPVPRVEHVRAADGTSRDFLQFEGLGRTGEATAFWRNLSRAFPRGSTTPPHGVTAPSTEPAEHYVVDLLVPRGWSDPSTAQVSMTENNRYSVGAPGFGMQRLPFEGQADYLGTRPESLYTRHAPRYAEIVAEQLRALGWSDTTFDIYRCTVAYPVLHTAIHLWVG